MCGGLQNAHHVLILLLLLFLLCLSWRILLRDTHVFLVIRATDEFVCYVYDVTETQIHANELRMCFLFKSSSTSLSVNVSVEIEKEPSVR